MDNPFQNPKTLAAGLPFWRKAGVDFDRGRKSSLAELLELGGLFPLCKVEDRLPLSHHCLYQWARVEGGGDLSTCFLPIRTQGRGRALTILVDLVRLNELLSAQVRSRLVQAISEPNGPGSGLALSQESA